MHLACWREEPNLPPYVLCIIGDGLKEERNRLADLHNLAVMYRRCVILVLTLKTGVEVGVHGCSSPTDRTYLNGSPFPSLLRVVESKAVVIILYHRPEPKPSAVTVTVVRQLPFDWPVSEVEVVITGNHGGLTIIEKPIAILSALPFTLYPQDLIVIKFLVSLQHLHLHAWSQCYLAILCMGQGVDLGKFRRHGLMHPELIFRRESIPFYCLKVRWFRQLKSNWFEVFVLIPCD